VCSQPYGSVKAGHEPPTIEKLYSRSLADPRDPIHPGGRQRLVSRSATEDLGQLLQLVSRSDFFWMARSSPHIIDPFVKQGGPTKTRFQRGALLMNNGTSEDVARRAYELFLSRNGQHGRDVDDWLEAERQLRSNGTPRPSRRSASNTRAVKTPARKRAR
jgi:hypothetical protein